MSIPPDPGSSFPPPMHFYNYSTQPQAIYNQSSSTSKDTNKPPKRARTFTPIQTNENDFGTTQEHPQQPKQKTYVSKYISNNEFPPELRSYLKLQKEIKRCKPSIKILNAYVNNKDQLIIRTNCEESDRILQEDWSADAFTYGIKKINSTPKFFIALHNLNTVFDVDDIENKEYMLENYKITNMMRITKKSINKPLDLVKAIVCDYDTFKSITDAKKIVIGCSRIRVSPWKFDIRPDQCFHCQKMGHFAEKCPDKFKKPTCLKCAKNHHHSDCPLNKNNDQSKYRCANCNGNHAACSKSCEVLKKEVERKKEILENKTKKQSKNFTRVESTAPQPITAAPRSSNSNQQGQFGTFPVTTVILFIINILKEFNNIHEVIYESPEELAKIVSNHFGQSYGQIIEKQLIREVAIEEMEDDDDYDDHE